MVAKTVPIATSSLPSGTRMLAKTPLAGASRSTPAFSVLSSAITSVSITVSPTCLSHRTIVAEAISSESFGSRISVTMNQRPARQPASSEAGVESEPASIIQ